MSVTRLSEMLHGARMADLVKLQRGTRPAGQRRQWAGSRQSSTRELAQLLHHAHFDNKGAKCEFAALARHLSILVESGPKTGCDFARRFCAAAARSEPLVPNAAPSIFRLK